MEDEARIEELRANLCIERLYSVGEVAQALHVSRSTIYNAIYAGELRARRPVGRKNGYKLTPEDVNEWYSGTLEVVNK